MRISSSTWTTSRAPMAARGRQRHARGIRTRMVNSRMDEIFRTGLHEFIGSFIADNNKLGAMITEQYLL